MSADGRYVVFSSDASNLVANDTNVNQDVFIRDQVTHTTKLVSVDITGGAANGDSYSPVISADGRFVAFLSRASDLVANDTNGTQDIFIRDMQSNGPTKLVSVNTTGGSGNKTSYNPVLSADGRYVAFLSNASDLVANDSNGTQDVFIRDMQSNGPTKLVSVNTAGGSGNNFSTSPVISADGRYVAFQSDASNLVANDSNGTTDVFIRDTRLNGPTKLVSVNTAGRSANGDSTSPVISADGRYVAFTSDASNLVANDSNGTQDVFIRDMKSSSPTKLVSVNAAGGSTNGDSYSPVLSADGRYVAFYSYASNLVANDNNGTADVFIRDMKSSGPAKLVSVNAAGGSGNKTSTNPVISADGRYVAFTSDASNLVANDSNGTTDVFIRDMQSSGPVTLVSVNPAGGSGNKTSSSPVLSADGRYVAFTSDANDLTSEHDLNAKPDVFLYSVATGTPSLITIHDPGLVSVTGATSSGVNGDSSMSADGRYVAFTSDASNLVANDNNGTTDVFIRDMLTHTTKLVSVNAAGSSGNGSSFSPKISADGRYVAFLSNASDLVTNDTNSSQDVFIRDMQSSDPTKLVSVNLTGGSGNSFSTTPVISADGRYVAFQSDASNLVANDTNGTTDVFIRDMQSNGPTKLVSVNTAGGSANGDSHAPVISADGRYVAFFSYASNLVANDTNGTADVFIRDMQSNGPTKLVSVNTAGGAGNSFSTTPVISADGRYVAFYSNASDLTTNDTNGTRDIFIRDMQSSDPTKLVSVNLTGGSGNSSSSNPVISADGRYVAFTSNASNLVANDTNGTTDVFIRDMQSSEPTKLVSINTAGGSGNKPSSNPVISADGRYVAFQSDASNLVANDSNGVSDVFIRDMQSSVPTQLVSVDSTGGSANSASTSPALSADGRYIGFTSLASNLVQDDYNSASDVFVTLVNPGTSVVSTKSVPRGNVSSGERVFAAADTLDTSTAVLGSGQSNILPGGESNPTPKGGSRPNLLIGGDGSTSSNLDIAALQAVMDQWNLPDSDLTRTGIIRSGFVSGTRTIHLGNGQVIDDLATDVLTGS